jgi:asparaginyl-tRNA synthetase
VTKEVFDIPSITPTGTSVLLKGTIVQAPEGKKQLTELQVAEVLMHGPCNAKTYPIAKGKVCS